MFGINKKKELETKQDINPIETERKENKKINSNQGFEYSIEIYDVWDTTSKRITPFGANRVVEDNNSYLFNELKGFKEPFPQNTEEYKEYELDDINLKIKKLEDEIKRFEKSPDQKISIKDKKKELRIFRGYKRSIELRGNGSFMILNERGIPTFQFDRVGNTKLPLYKNVDRSTIYIPSELKTKNITKILRDNDEKNKTTTLHQWSTYTLLLILVLLTCVYIWYGYKAMTLPVDVSEILALVGENLQTISKDLNSLSSELIINETDKVIPGQQNIR